MGELGLGEEEGLDNVLIFCLLPYFDPVSIQICSYTSTVSILV